MRLFKVSLSNLGLLLGLLLIPSSPAVAGIWGSEAKSNLQLMLGHPAKNKQYRKGMTWALYKLGRSVDVKCTRVTPSLDSLTADFSLRYKARRTYTVIFRWKCSLRDPGTVSILQGTTYTVKEVARSRLEAYMKQVWKDIGGGKTPTPPRSSKALWVTRAEMAFTSLRREHIFNYDVQWKLKKYTHPSGRDSKLVDTTFCSSGREFGVRMTIQWKGLLKKHSTTIEWRCNKRGHVSSRVSKDSATIKTLLKKQLDSYLKDYAYTMLLARMNNRKGLGGNWRGTISRNGISSQASLRLMHVTGLPYFMGSVTFSGKEWLITYKRASWDGSSKISWTMSCKGLPDLVFTGVVKKKMYSWTISGTYTWGSDTGSATFTR